jgi:copper transport protein
MARTMRTARVLVVLAALFGWMVAFAPAAWAHAELVSTTPGNGEHLAQGPAEVTLKFSENVNLVHDGIQVRDGDGRRVDTGSPKGSGDTVRVPLRPGLEDGVYTVDWRVVSADSHPIHGAFVFSVGEATVAPLTGPVNRTGADPVVTGAFWLFRWGGYAALALLVGGLFFRVVCWPGGGRDPRARLIVRGGWVASLVAAVGGLLLQGPNSAGSSIWQAFSPSLLWATVRTDFGVAVLVRLVLLAVLAVAINRLFAPAAAATATAGGARDGRDATAEAGAARPKTWQVPALAATCLAFVGTWSWAGHAHVGDQAALSVVTDVAHLSAMSVWVGGLVLLTTCVLPQRRAVLGEAAAVLPRFSLSAMSAVGVLVCTGTYQAWREVRSVSALAGTQYGKLLIFKLAAFGVLMALAAMSRSVVQRRYVVPVARAAAAQAAARSREARDAGRVSKKQLRAQEAAEREALGALRQSVRLEACVVLGVLALTAALVATPPGQVAGAFEAAPGTEQQQTQTLPFSTRIPLTGVKDAGSVQVDLKPARVGPNQLVLSLYDKNAVLHNARGVTAQLTLPARKLGPLPVTLQNLAPGQYNGGTVTIPQSGRWHLTVSVRVSEFDEAKAEVDIPVG